MGGTVWSPAFEPAPSCSASFVCTRAREVMNKRYFIHYCGSACGSALVLTCRRCIAYWGTPVIYSQLRFLLLAPSFLSYRSSTERTRKLEQLREGLIWFTRPPILRQGRTRYSTDWYDGLPHSIGPSCACGQRPRSFLGTQIRSIGERSVFQL